MEYTFTQAEVQEIQKHVAKYPDRHSAIMPALWIAQEKFGWLSADAIKLVADTLDVPYARVYGVATFYTMYLKQDCPPNLIEVCTCFTCGECGGKERMAFLKDYLQTNEKGRSADGQFWIREAECLGACDTAPVGQISNRRFVHNLTDEKLRETIERLRRGEVLSFEAIPLNDQTPLG
ncbi:MAG: NAD(P)H-dependent oxidoreductase subunit E [Bacteroidia bacterium]|nr:NAD(P)H-dependent oxidoreductase subunit E [Bacteroidia bacterium]